MRLILYPLVPVCVGAAMGGLMFGADLIGFYPILLMPLAVGLAVGMATTFPAASYRFSTFPLLIVALVGCAAAVGVYWGGTYLKYREDVTQLLQTEWSVSREEAAEALPLLEHEVFGTSGFPAMMAQLAETGISITPTTSDSFTLDGGIAYAYWIAEIVLIVIVAWFGVFRRNASNIAKKDDPEKPEPASISNDVIRR